MRRTFEEVEGYDDMIVLKDIRFELHCEHHLAPIIGRAHVGYLPDPQGGRHLQAGARGRGLCPPPAGAGEDERPDRQHASRRCCEPKGVAVVIEATHQCMTTRGVHKTGVTMVTSTMLGDFRNNEITRREFLAVIGNPTSSMDG